MQKAKIVASIVVTESGIVIISNEEHNSNAQLSIVVTESGIVIFFNEEHEENA